MNIFLILACILLLFTVMHLHRSKRAKKKTIRIVAGNCSGCGRCVKMCRHKALKITDTETGPQVVMKFSEKCTVCGNCVAMCKYNALEIVNRNLAK